MNKGALRTQFKNLLNRSDITNDLADTFIDQGIARIQRTLRIPSMEKKQNYIVSASTTFIVLPNDFLEAIDLYYDGRSLERIPMKEMQELKKNSLNDAPLYFAREQSNFLIYPHPKTGTLSLNYYGQYADMTLDSDENQLAIVASDLIIYGALTYASDYYLDERSELFEAKYRTYLAEVQQQADDAELTGTLQTIRPAYTY
jgi:hypothetical protein